MSHPSRGASLILSPRKAFTPEEKVFPSRKRRRKNLSASGSLYALARHPFFLPPFLRHARLYPGIYWARNRVQDPLVEVPVVYGAAPDARLKRPSGARYLHRVPSRVRSCTRTFQQHNNDSPLILTLLLCFSKMNADSKWGDGFSETSLKYLLRKILFSTSQQLLFSSGGVFFSSFFV